MNLFQSMRVFCTVAEHKSFTAAADKLNIAHSAVSRHVAQLEHRLAARLLNRTSRRVSLTEVGEAYLEQARRLLDSIGEMEERVRTTTVKPSGILRISIPPWLADEEFVLLLARYQATYPEVRLDIDLDLVELGTSHEYGDLDIALRVTNVPDTGMIARHLSTLTFRIVASPEYLDAHGRPEKPEDLDGWPLLHYSAYSPDVSVVFRTGQHVTFKPTLRSSSAVILLHAVRAGMGPAFIPSALIERDVAEGRLEYLLPAETASPMRLYALCPRRPYLSAKVTTFLEYLEAAYATAPGDPPSRSGVKDAIRKHTPPRSVHATTTSSE